jgi:hypothetical protein
MDAFYEFKSNEDPFTLGRIIGKYDLDNNVVGDLLGIVRDYIPVNNWLDFAKGYCNGANMDNGRSSKEINYIEWYLGELQKLNKHSSAKEDKKRVDLDVRPEGPWYSSYDYGGPEEASDSGPGRGLYNGKMDKHKSVKDFIDKKRKRKRQLRKKAWEMLLDELQGGRE